MNPKYPIYIISKNRWKSRLTSRTLEYMRVPYHIVIEPQEYNNYTSVIDSKKILILPFSNLGKGSIPARNWVWEHSISIGAEQHWIMDDNIKYFFRRNNNIKIRVASGTIFKAAEDFVNRYENIAISGFQYDYFAPNIDLIPVYILNTRIYSCILIKNNIPHRWRGRYNEDTDLSIRILKDGLCTILFQAFLQGKTPTGQMEGGNTDELYKADGRLKMAESLVEQHPDITKVVRKYGRWQHQVDYSSLRNNRLIKKPNIEISEGINNYGMVLKELTKKEEKEHRLELF